MTDRIYMQDAESVMKAITKGAFLTVRAENEVNTMTIGWATIGFIWKKEVFMVAVRNTRHTFKLIEKADNFTVSIPRKGDHKDAVMFCGTKSGRDYDKFKECGLGVKNAQQVASPIIDIPGVHYECNIIYKSAMDPSNLVPALDEKLYPEKDYHTLYFGEILACYEI